MVVILGLEETVMDAHIVHAFVSFWFGKRHPTGVWPLCHCHCLLSGLGWYLVNAVVNKYFCFALQVIAKNIKWTDCCAWTYALLLRFPVMLFLC